MKKQTLQASHGCAPFTTTGRRGITYNVLFVDNGSLSIKTDKRQTIIGEYDGHQQYQFTTTPQAHNQLIAHTHQHTHKNTESNNGRQIRSK